MPPRGLSDSPSLKTICRSNRPMRIIQTRDAIRFVLVLLIVVSTISCAAAKKITEDVMGKEGRLKKKIAFLPTSNVTGYGGNEFSNLAGTHLDIAMKDSCHDVVVAAGKEVGDILRDTMRPASGEFGNQEIVKAGRTLGVNAVVEQSLSGIECLTRKCGIWGFRDTCTFVALSVRVRAYDIETGAVLFDDMVHGEVDMSDFECEEMGWKGRYNSEMAERLLDRTTPDVWRIICERLAADPWKGYVAEASGDTFVVTGGTDVGLAAGDVLEVFGHGEPVKGDGGMLYVVSGGKIGEIRIVKVYRDRSEAILVTGSDLGNSNCVKLKK